MLVLKALSLGPMHGYGVAQRIQPDWPRTCCASRRARSTRQYLRIEQRQIDRREMGSVSDNNRRARFYTLSRVGRKRLASELSNWEHLSLAIRKIVEAT